MKAARIRSFGPPDVVVVEDVPVPSPGPGEVLVRVMAAGVAPLVGAIFFYADVTTARLQTLTTLFDTGRITTRVGIELRKDAIRAPTLLIWWKATWRGR